MIDTTRAMRASGFHATEHNGPVTLIAVDGDDIVVRTAGKRIVVFTRRGKAQGLNSRILLENIPTKVTTRYYARRSTARPNEIKLQSVRPVTSIGEIEIDVENNRIVGARVVS